jgi:hypothetical protein
MRRLARPSMLPHHRKHNRPTTDAKCRSPPIDIASFTSVTVQLRLPPFAFPGVHVLLQFGHNVQRFSSTSGLAALLAS